MRGELTLPAKPSRPLLTDAPAPPVLPTRFWREMSARDFAGCDAASLIAVLPLAATEQHGPHLPLAVDSLIMEFYLAQVAARLPTALPVLFLPVQEIGASIEHEAFPGTLSQSTATLLGAWQEIAAGVRRTGCRKLVLANTHGGNSPLMTILAHELRARLGMLVVTASFARFGTPPGLFPADEIEHGVHGGDIETSLMLAYRPDLVQMPLAEDFPNADKSMAARHKHLRAGRPTGFGWMAQDLGAAGALGNAAAATAAKGEACVQHGAAAFVELLEDVAAFDLATLAEGPLSTIDAPGPAP